MNEKTLPFSSTPDVSNSAIKTKKGQWSFTISSATGIFYFIHQ
jgi:hypothetical protein